MNLPTKHEQIIRDPDLYTAFAIHLGVVLVVFTPGTCRRRFGLDNLGTLRRPEPTRPNPPRARWTVDRCPGHLIIPGHLDVFEPHF